MRQRGIVLRGLLPHLPGVGGKVHFVIAVVEHARAFGVEVANDGGLFVLEEGFVGAHDLGVFLQALLDAGAQLDQALHTLGRQERVAAYLFRLLADAVYPAGALNEPDDGPGQVEVHDGIAVLKVLAFRQHIGTDQHADLVGLRHVLVVGTWRELAGHRIGVCGRAGSHREVDHAALAQFAPQVAGGVGKLGEHQHLVFGVRLGHELSQLGQFAVTRCIPCPVGGQQLAQ